MKNSWKLFNYGETPVYLKYWFLILFLFFGASFVVSIFVSVLIHELAHSFVANKLGYRTDSIVIDVFYGAANIDSQYVNNHNHTIKIALAGPISNLLLSFVSLSLCVVFQDPLSSFLLVLAAINLLLAVVNLIPVFPLDGGRISKSLLSKFLGNSKGRYYNGILSLSFSVLIGVYAILQMDFLLIIFVALFIITAIAEIKGENLNQ